MAVITISRELGSGGDRIVDMLCEELGYCRVDKAFLSQIAQEAGVDVTLEVYPEMIHIFQLFAPVLPEGQQAIDKIGAFLKSYVSP